MLFSFLLLSFFCFHFSFLFVENLPHKRTRTRNSSIPIYSTCYRVHIVRPQVEWRNVLRTPHTTQAWTIPEYFWPSVDCSYTRIPCRNVIWYLKEVSRKNDEFVYYRNETTAVMSERDLQTLLRQNPIFKVHSAEFIHLLFCSMRKIWYWFIVENVMRSAFTSVLRWYYTITECIQTFADVPKL